MPALGFPTQLRGCLALVLCGAGAVGAWGLAGDPFRQVTALLAAGGPASLAALPLDQVLAGLCATALLGSSAWLLGSTALVSLTRLAGALAPGSPLVARCARAAERSCPAVARAAVVTALGLSVGTTTVGPALADSGHAAPGAAPGVASLTGLPLPDRAAGVAGPAQHAVETADPLQVEPHPAAHGAGQPCREVDLGVLRAALLGHQRVSLGQGEAVRLLLEVVEQVEEPLFPAHPRTLAGRRRRVNRLWTNG